jgi:hypothetical protein
MLLEDIFKDLNSPSGKWVRRFLKPIAWPSINRFANIATSFDWYVENAGFREAMRQILPWFVSHVEVQGADNAPEEGPLLVVSNHPGTYDSLVITANLPRNDLKIIAGGFPLLRGLPHAREHFIFIEEDIHSRMAVVRAAIRHLQVGGSLLIFPSGRVEPDPASLPGAFEAMKNWSPSLDIFLRSVPQTKVLLAIVSDVLSPKFLNSPLIRLWRGMRNPQTTAEVLQVLIQMIFPGRVDLVPRLSFGLPLDIDALSDREDGAALRDTIISQAQSLLAEHCLVQTGQI